MRIAVSGPMDADSFADNVVDTLRRMGHDVYPLGPARQGARLRKLSNIVEVISDHERRLDSVRQRSMRERVAQLAPDLLLTVDRRLDAEVIKAAQRAGTRVALWFPDHTGTMANHDMFLAGYDRIYLKNPVLARDLATIQGLPIRHLPEAANSRWHVASSLPYGGDAHVVMAGNVHPTRALLIDRLIGDGIPVSIYGAPMARWIDMPRVRASHTGQYLAREDKARVFRSARAVLNNLHPAESAGMNCRLFEAAGSGAAVLTEDRPGLRDLFVPGKEVFAYSSYDELLGTLRQLLGDDGKGASVGDAAALRTHGQHTYEHRLATILEDLF